MITKAEDPYGEGRLSTSQTAGDSGGLKTRGFSRGTWSQSFSVAPRTPGPQRWAERVSRSLYRHKTIVIASRTVRKQRREKKVSPKMLFGRFLGSEWGRRLRGGATIAANRLHECGQKS